VDEVAEVLFADVRKTAAPQEGWKDDYLMLNDLEKLWSRGPDLNRGPVDYEMDAFALSL
jgi:hypothetical protein